MKRWTVLMAAMLFSSAGFAQKDSSSSANPDTIKVGNFVIVKKNKGKEIDDNNQQKKYQNLRIHFGNGEEQPIKITSDSIQEKPHIDVNFHMGNHKKRKLHNISTNWWIFDLGFTNVRDNSNYTAAQSMGYLTTVHGSPVNQNSFALNTGKSSNVNIWLFMQKLNISKNIVNLKYGFGLEMYNFRYDHNLSYRSDPVAHVFNDTIGFSKDKLYAGYLTIPVMLNFNTAPHNRNGFSISAGLSAGYLVGDHGKQISAERGKQKYHGDLGLQPWRLAAITELGLGPIRLYGSYSFNALHKESTGVDQFPYAIGIRFSNW